MSTTDAELIDAIARKNEDAFEALFVAHSPFLYGLACRMCGPTLAGEIVATVLADLWADPHRCQPDQESLARFLHVATHRQSLHRLRDSRARRIHDSDDVFLKLSAAGLIVDGDAVQRVVGHGSAVRLGVLTEGERNVFVLAYFGGYTCADLAAILGQTEAQIASQISSGLHRLRESVVPAGPAVPRTPGVRFVG